MAGSTNDKASWAWASQATTWLMLRAFESDRRPAGTSSYASSRWTIWLAAHNRPGAGPRRHRCDAEHGACGSGDRGRVVPRLQQRPSFMREPVNTLQRFLQQKMSGNRTVIKCGRLGARPTCSDDAVSRAVTGARIQASHTSCCKPGCEPSTQRGLPSLQK